MQQHTLPPKDADDDGLDLVGLLGTLVDHKWLIGGVTAAFCAAGFIHATLATPIYRADALVQVERKSGGVAGLGEMSEMLGAEPRANTEIELIKSRTVIGKAVDSLQLDVQVEPVRMPVLGDWFARSFRPATAGELAEPRFGLDGYAWGGERLELFRLELPPHLVGRSLALDPVMVLLALVVLGWAWGATGLLIAVPLLSCAKIIAERMPDAQPLAILLSR